MGVRADQILDFLALTGDSVDNIPGVRGVGPKAATALLGEFEDLAAIYDDLEKVETLPVRGAKGLRKKLEEGRDMAEMSRKLVELEFEAPCELCADDIRYRGADSNEIEAFAEQWGLGRVASRVPRR
jgi:5'-3' exonuclease